MPEMPEVETVRRSLNTLIKGKEIKKVDIIYEGIIKGIAVEKFKSMLEKQKIETVERYGKYLMFKTNKYYMVSHLRMEGKYNFYQKPDEFNKTKHDHVIFYFVDNSILVYNDTRKFGTMEIVDKESLWKLKGLAKLGVEANDEKNLTVQYLVEKMGHSNKKIKEFLLDQTVISGLGNIYVDEVLFASKVHPEKRIQEISKVKLKSIIENSIKIMNEAIENKGTTIKSFTISNGETGNFQHTLKVYQRTGKECYNCNSKIKKIKVGGRGTHYCPKCQRK